MNKYHILKSSFKSITWCFILLIFYVIYETKAIISYENILSFLETVPVFGIFYLAFSAIGWLFLGFPWHWFLYKFSYKSYFSYAFPALIFIAGSIIFKEYEVGFAYGCFSLVQALIFRYYVYKQI